VGTAAKLRLMLRALPAALLAPGHPLEAGASAPPLAAVRYLVEAAARDDLPQRTYWQRAVRVLEITERARGRVAQHSGGSTPWASTASSS
jgi:hypothetical protein